MIAATGLKWLMTALFAAIAAYAAWRVAAGPRTAGAHGHRATDRVAHALHAVMAVAMAVMVWPAGMRVPAVPQVVFFVLAAAWFPAVPLARAWLVRAPRGGLARGLGHALPHALAMGAMAWMAAAMAGGPMPGAGGAGDAMADMPGMDMSAPGSTATMTLRGPDATVAWLLALAFLVLALWWLARGFDGARLAPRTAGGPALPAAAPPAAARQGLAAYDLCCHGAMALGMAVMLAVLA
ncbi:DUF5134 domain-containing protein [Streptomyces sp. NRRL F-5126]|uniref:DUF5134 domain-containing protein n=1 Tax=Streptomyces sp. NRRL F-5126 TaxID=1463857 RepID=UPI0004CABDBD|nr:DUF5134 domain-containing protein [Streptomyces sp. NRRL F-5126]